MANKVYRAVFKSEEKRGSSGANIITFGWNDTDEAAMLDWVSDADAGLASLIAGDLMCVTKETTKDYTQPYPTGSFVTARLLFRSAAGGLFTQWVKDLDPAASPSDFAAALLGLGLEGLFSSEAVTSVQVVPTDTEHITPV